MVDIIWDLISRNNYFFPIFKSNLRSLNLSYISFSRKKKNVYFFVGVLLWALFSILDEMALTTDDWKM